MVSFGGLGYKDKQFAIKSPYYRLSQHDNSYEFYLTAIFPE